VSRRVAVSAALVLVAVPLAHAQFAKPEDAVKYRQSAMFMMNHHAARLGAMAQGKVAWDAEVASANAETLATLAKLPWPAFTAGTDRGDTRAKADVWSDNAKFTASAQKLQEETGRLAAAAKAGDQAAMKSAFGEVGRTCKGCHDQFRKD
jgi:cytochrome c556